MSPSEAAANSASGPLRFATATALVVAVIALAVWLWSRVCDFPAQPWNDIRLAPTVALAQGWPVFPTAEQGTINTWTYGPLPLLWSWPATWASSAGRALMIAAGMNLLLVLLPIAVVCFRWPEPHANADSYSGPFDKLRAGRGLALIVCVALWPERNYAVLSADNLAIACGLIGNLVLVRAQRPWEFWCAATLASAAIACKQTAAGIPLAQVIWLGVVVGVRPALGHALRCAVAGMILGALCIPVFGGAGLQFVLLELAAHFKWAPHPVERLTSVWLELLAQVTLPTVIMLAARRVFARREWLLPALAWLCALPLGMSALLKFGGRMNSVYSYMLWLPPVVTLVMTARWSEARRRALQLGALAGAILIICSRIVETPRFFLRPQLEDYREAARIGTQLRGQVWFPLHPLITLYSEKRYYHDEDGLYVRRMTHKAVTPGHAAAQLPPGFRAVALHEGWTDFGIARAMMPENARHLVIGNWNLFVIEPGGRP